MKIAAYVDADGAAAGFYEKGAVCLYRQVSGKWELSKKIPLEIDLERGLAETKETFFAAMAQLEDCRVFIVREFKGLFHALLMEELGFHTWKSEGSMLEQLDNVVRQETAYVAELEKQAAVEAGKLAAKGGGGGCGGGCSSGGRGAQRGVEVEARAAAVDAPQALPVGASEEGRYSINLAQMLLDNPALNSRQILIPALEETSFKKLEVICDHVPRWFCNELRNLRLTAESPVPDESGRWLKITVSPT